MTNYTFDLSNGIKVPAPAFGTWCTYGDATIECVKTALAYGYRHIDTATRYENEREVGIAVRTSDIAREDIFITSKVWNTERGYDKTLRAFENTMNLLQMDYLDLYLIHWPANEKVYGDRWEYVNIETWQALERLYKEGRIRAIGVSNFFRRHLQILQKNCEILPMVDQLKIHPGTFPEDALCCCRELGILPAAWSPLGRGAPFTHPVIVSLSEKYGRSPAQICIRWCLQMGTMPLPKSVTPERIRDNLNVFDFTFTEEEMTAITSIRLEGLREYDPDTMES